jgi:hypothetical protein
MVNRAAALILISLLVASCLNVSRTKAIVELPKQVHMSLDTELRAFGIQHCKTRIMRQPVIRQQSRSVVVPT